MRHFFYNLSTIVINLLAAQSMILLAPLFMALGIIGYYQLPFEPWLPWSMAALLGWGIVVIMLRRNNMALLAMAAWWVLFGFTLSGWHGYIQQRHDIAPAVRANIFSIKFLQGQIIALRSSNSDRIAAILKVTEVDGVATTPFLIRLTDRRKTLGEDSFQGNILPLFCDMTVKARVFPLPLKPSLNGYDLGRDWYFHGYRAAGQFLGAPLIDPSCDKATSHAISQKIKNDIVKNYPPAVGGMVLAMITGERSGIDSALMEQYRQSGLIHLISISGVHMGLIAGMAFLLLRWLLLLIRPSGDGYLFKKIAAAGAMVIIIFYFLLADYSSASLRATLTTMVAFIGVMLGRRAISLESLALSMLLVLCYRSSDLFNPGFQLSFSAMLVLVGLYEKFWQPLLAEIEKGIFFRQRGDKATDKATAILTDQPPPLTDKKPPPPLFKKIQIVFFALLVSGTMITLTALPISLFHFHQSSLFGIIANMAAIPLMDILAMPLLFLKVLLLPVTSYFGGFYPLDWLITKIFQLLNWLAANLHGDEKYLVRGGRFGLDALFFYGVAFYLFVVGGAGLKKISYGSFLLFLLLVVATPQPWLVVSGLEPGGHTKWMARVNTSGQAGGGSPWVSPFGNSFVQRLWMQEYGITKLEKKPPPPSVCSRNLCQMVWQYHHGKKFTATMIGGYKAGADGDNSALVESLCRASNVIIGRADTAQMRLITKTCPDKTLPPDTATMVVLPTYIGAPRVARVTLRPRPWVTAATLPQDDMSEDNDKDETSSSVAP